MRNLEEFYIEIVKANLVKEAQEEAGNPVSTPEKPKNNSLNQNTSTESSAQTATQNQPASNTVPTAPKPKMIADSVKKTENTNQDTTTETPEGSSDTSQTYQPNQTYTPQQAYKKSNILNDLVSLAISENKQNYIKAINYYSKTNVKNKVLNKLSNKNIIIKKIGSNKKTSIVLNEKNYNQHIREGIEKIYLPLTENQNQITIKAQNCDLYKVKQAFSELYKDEQINKCSIVKNKNELYITCSTEKDIRALPIFIIEKINKISGTFEIPTENRLCIIPESIFEGEECFIL